MWENCCKYCGMIHDHVCPRIKSIEYYPNGTIKKVELQETIPERKHNVGIDMDSLET